MGNRLHDGCPDGRPSGWDDGGGDLFRSAGAEPDRWRLCAVDTEVNAESAHVQGIETEVTLRPLRWLDLHATYTLLNTASKRPAGGIRLAVAAAAAEHGVGRSDDPADAALRFVATLSMPAPIMISCTTTTATVRSRRGWASTGLIANVAINYTATPQVELYVNAWNILNSKFEPVNGYQTPGRLCWRACASGSEPPHPAPNAVRLCTGRHHGLVSCQSTLAWTGLRRGWTNAARIRRREPSPPAPRSAAAAGFDERLGVGRRLQRNDAVVHVSQTRLREQRRPNPPNSR